MDVYRAYPWLLELACAVLGALVGSFLNVVIARLPEGLSVVRPRSRCPKCHDAIPAYLNIPVLSWLVLRGRCRACRAPISIRYPLVELLTAILFFAAARRFGLSPALVPALVMVAALVAITFIDLDHFIIPDEISLPGLLLAVVARPLIFPVPWYSGLLGAALGAGFLWLIRWGFFKLRGIEGMGMGDVKLLGMLGGFLGPAALLPLILIASISGTVIGSLALWLSPAPPEEPPGSEALAAPAAETGAGEPPASPGEPLALAAADPHEAGGETDPHEVEGSGQAGEGEAPAPAEPHAASGEAGDAADSHEVEGSGQAGEAPAPAEPHDAGGEAGDAAEPHEVEGSGQAGEAPAPAEPHAAGGEAGDEDEDEDEDDWVPPPGAVPFGPFLAIGGLAMLLMGPTIMGWLRLLL